MRAAMQPYSWTNNRYGRYFGRAATSRTTTGGKRRTASHAGRDIGGPLGQPFSYFRAADAVSLFEARAQCRLYRAWLRADRLRGYLRVDPGPDRLSGRSYRRAKDSADGPLFGRRRADRSRPASQLS